MHIIDHHLFKQVELPRKSSHKAENGKLMIIGGSRLFHGASLWALKVASRIVDMVYYSSVEENLILAQYLKSRLYSFIAVPQGKEAVYIQEADAILIGPGMVRGSKAYTGTGESGEKTHQHVMALLSQFPEKRWIIDAGALQVLKPDSLFDLKQVMITPHLKEFEKVFDTTLVSLSFDEKVDLVAQYAKNYDITIVLKGEKDIIANKDTVLINHTGNEGMTKGGTGDVLAGLVAALATKNDLLLAAAIGVYVNGLAGDQLYQKVGPFFNADDLAKEVPRVLWQELKRK